MKCCNCKKDLSDSKKILLDTDNNVYCDSCFVSMTKYYVNDCEINNSENCEVVYGEEKLIKILAERKSRLTSYIKDIEKKEKESDFDKAIKQIYLEEIKQIEKRLKEVK